MSTVTEPKRTQVSVREVTRNFSKLYARAQRGEYFSVQNRGEEVCSIAPPAPQKKKYTLADFKKIQFHSGERNLSSRVDELLYG
jgi:antitoxin (DNA-binding transcriptional repressor) of toxin-antitoxin stability system